MRMSHPSISRGAGTMRTASLLAFLANEQASDNQRLRSMWMAQVGLTAHSLRVRV